MAERYYHICPVCGRKRLCIDNYGIGTVIHRIKCTAACAAKGTQPAVKAEQGHHAKHLIAYVGERKGAHHG